MADVWVRLQNASHTGEGHRAQEVALEAEPHTTAPDDDVEEENGDAEPAEKIQARRSTRNRKSQRKVSKHPDIRFLLAQTYSRCLEWTPSFLHGYITGKTWFQK